MSTRYVPRDLKPEGRRLWREVHAAYPELSIGERLLLEQACRCADLVDSLHTQSQEPRCPRGTLAELRGQRAALAKLISQLKI
jgi:hypothetical protein